VWLPFDDLRPLQLRALGDTYARQGGGGAAHDDESHDALDEVEGREFLQGREGRTGVSAWGCEVTCTTLTMSTSAPLDTPPLGIWGVTAKMRMTMASMRPPTAYSLRRGGG